MLHRRSAAVSFGKQCLAAVLIGLTIVPPTAYACTEDEVTELEPFEFEDEPCDSIDLGNGCTMWDCGASGSSIECDPEAPDWEPEFPPINPDDIDWPEYDPPPSCSGTDCSEDSCDEANRFTAGDGNAQRAVADLRYGGVHRRFSWVRHHNTRARGGATPFGTRSGWRHAWQYELVDHPATDKTPSTFGLIGPTGIGRIYAKGPDGSLMAEPGRRDQVEKTAAGYNVTTETGLKLVFVETTENNAALKTFRLTQAIDVHGQITRFDYNAQGLLVAISSDSGRRLELSYKTFDLMYVTRIEIGRADADGWNRVSAPEAHAATRFNRVRVRLPEKAKCALAEIRCLSLDGTPVTGAPYGAAGAGAAFDANTSTAVPSQGEQVEYYGLDFGSSGAAIASVEVLGSAGEKLPGAIVEGFTIRPISVPLIAEVRADDGQVVKYSYELNRDELFGHEGIVLTRVDYDDGTSARYRYERVEPWRKTLLVEADDPRYIGKAKKIMYTYQPGPNREMGFLYQELNPVTRGVYATLRLDPNDKAKRIVDYSDHKQITFKLDANGRVQERTDGIGRKLKFTRNQLQRVTSSTDYRNRKTEFDYDNRGKIRETRREGKIAYRRQADAQTDTGESIRGSGVRKSIRKDKSKRTLQVAERGVTLTTHFDTRMRSEKTITPMGTYRYVRDAKGQLLEAVRPDGRKTSYEYNAQGHVIAVTDKGGRTSRVERNKQGAVTKITSADGLVRSFAYDKYGRKISQTDHSGRKKEFAYDDLGRVTSETAADGGVTTYDYTELPQGCGSCTLAHGAATIRHPDGRVTKNLFDSEGRLLARTENAGTSAEATIVYTYDEDNNLLSVTDPIGRVTRHTYDNERNRLSTTDVLGRVTFFDYDEDRNLVSVTGPDGVIARYTYDEHGRRTSAVDALGQATRYEYDALGNLAATIDANGDRTKFVYKGKLRTAVVYADGKRQTWEYDELSRPVRSVNAQGAITTQTYDLGSRLLAQTIAAPGSAPSTTSYTYDALGRRLSTTDALGRTSTQTYDTLGNVLSSTRPDGVTTFQTYDAQRRVSNTTDAAGHVTRYEYDTAGNVITLIDAKGNRYSFTYDGARRKTSMTYPDGTQETWNYNRVGQVLRYANRMGHVQTSTYNAAGQRTRESWTPAGVAPDTHYEYDPEGRPAAVDNGHARLSYRYDLLGRVVSEVTDIGALQPGMPAHTVAYMYDKPGRRAAVGYPDGSVAAYRYDLQGKLVGVDDDLHRRDQNIAAYAYDALGRVGGLIRDNGVETRHAYDVAGQLTAITYLKGTQVLASSAYTLDILGRRTSQTREDRIPETYRYDASGQLMAVDYGSASPLALSPPPLHGETFTYDAVGNRTEVARITPGAPPATETYQTNNLNQYTQIVGAGQASSTVNPVHDLNGNLLDDGRQRYRYDAKNRLIGAENVVNKAEFFYDPRNRCVLRRFYTLGVGNVWLLDNAQSRALTYDNAWNLLTERDLTGQTRATYIHGQRTDEILLAILDGKEIHPLADGLGSTIALTNKQGKVVQRYRYTAYGQPMILKADYSLPATNSSSSSYRFLVTGREWLGSVQLNDHRNRYYSPNLGRWTTTDPIGFKAKDANLYRYVGNRVLSANDPFGQQALAPMGVGPKGPTYGNWGGGGWSGGASGNEPPVDAFDACYKDHDLCYGSCPPVVCNYQLPRTRCMQACDNTLKTCVANAGPRPDWDTLQRWFIEGSESVPLWFFN
jgi:RHS repeat-associated protein